ncbi:MAG: hypothetical protein COB04_05275 [Gammaproteobacteria bacterium]|nr:MAG: hypothetical protein COB04_05275 [Gammaproteobacteria bacterium]
MKHLIFLFPVVLFLIFLGVKLISPAFYVDLIKEDSFIEYLQAFIYFSASIITFLVVVRFFRNSKYSHGVLYAVLSVGLLFIALEEISWGQRIFDIPNTEYFEEHNFQREISIHNLNTIQPILHGIYMLVGAYGAFAWLFVSRKKTNKLRLAVYITPEWFISSYFFFTFFVYTMFDFVFTPYSGGWLLWKDQEPIELLLSLGFLTFVVTNYIKSQRAFTHYEVASVE